MVGAVVEVVVAGGAQVSVTVEPDWTWVPGGGLVPVTVEAGLLQFAPPAETR